MMYWQEGTSQREYFDICGLHQWCQLSIKKLEFMAHTLSSRGQPGWDAESMECDTVRSLQILLSWA